MDIFLSVNNRAEVLQIPVVPDNFQVAKPQNNATFETATMGELKLYGTPKLKSISWSSFFPVRDYPFLKNRSIWGFDYIAKLDNWISQKLPIRLIITDTPINMPITIDDFSYSVGTDGNYNYSITCGEFSLYSAITGRIASEG